MRVVAIVKELGRGRKGLGSCGASRVTGGCYLRKGEVGGLWPPEPTSCNPEEWLSPEP